ncbi:MAG: glycosyltransferase family 1 protein [Chloroflexi bacterium]|nr:MAG: glycosyltransferase family 1 protein [Chloroflexota bacterium]MBL1193693.1 glycosyltransferase family 1 protein [Chloroflexota bacterium]NOH10985.1 glycosyltransferase family 4 protein [Chloroflexota bacterium]
MAARICMLVHQDFFRDARVKRYTDALLERGAEVDVICVRSGDAEQPVSYHENLKVYPIPMKRGYRGVVDYLLEYTWGFLLYFLRLTSLSLRRRHQAIHVHNMPDFFVFTTAVPKMLGAEIILDIHDPMPEFYASKFERSMDSWMVRIMRWQEHLSARVADVMVTVNDAVKHNLSLRGIPDQKITVVSNFPDPHIFVRQPAAQGEESPFTLIYPGTLASRYGLHVAINALPQIRQSIPGVCLVLLGHQVDYVKELEDLAQELQVADCVDIRDVVPIGQVPAAMAQADLGIYPALYDIHMDVATPTKVLEYAMMGLPILATRLSGIEAIFDDAAVSYVPPGNVEAFAQAVIDLHADPGKRAELVKQADVEFTSTHSWAQEFNKYVDLLRSLGLSV